MANVIIIGNGPAGILTALYTTRAGTKIIKYVTNNSKKLVHKEVTYA